MLWRLRICRCAAACRISLRGLRGVLLASPLPQRSHPCRILHLLPFFTLARPCAAVTTLVSSARCCGQSASQQTISTSTTCAPPSCKPSCGHCEATRLPAQQLPVLLLDLVHQRQHQLLPLLHQLRPHLPHQPLL